MKRRLLLAITLIAFALAVNLLKSCEKENENETKISTFNSDESHKSGQNCMDCHVSGNSGEGWFTVAGTVYDSTLNSTYPNVLVELYTGPNSSGTLITTIEVDALGNFYTTESVDLTKGLYASVVGDSESTTMAGAITNGKCNQCHGVSTDKIWL